jgi:hypothetical protein
MPEAPKTVSPSSPSTTSPDSWETAYPSFLREKEKELVRKRRTEPDEKDERPLEDRVGIALSGGGVRSATFSLGFFQGLATRGGLLRKLDFLSTVSGGGYFGGFYGRLFTRSYLNDTADVERILKSEPLPLEEDDEQGKELSSGKGEDERRKKQKKQRKEERRRAAGIVQNLRENGRFLSPNGGGDLLLGGAVLFRNWVSLQVVLWTFLLMVLLAAQLLRVAAEVLFDGPFTEKYFPLFTEPAGVTAHLLWWSPYLAVPAALFVFLAFPAGWAYWLVERVSHNLWIAVGSGAEGQGEADRPRASGWAKRRLWNDRVRPFWPLGAIVLLALVYGGVAALWGQELNLSRTAAPWVTGAVVVVMVLVVCCWWLARRRERNGRAGDSWEKRERHDADGEPARERSEGAEASEPSKEDVVVRQKIFEDSLVRNRLSRWVKTALVTTAAFLAFALIDTLGQSLYLVALDDTLEVGSWVGGLLGGLTLLSGFARRIAIKFAAGPDQGRVRLPLEIVATVGAFLAVTFLLVVLDAASHALAWSNRAPAAVLAEFRAGEETGTVQAEAKVPNARPLTLRMSVDARAGADEPESGPKTARRDAWSVAWTLAALLAFGGLSWLFGRIWPFVNRSSHHPLYTARLTRAYLGASNPDRLGPNPKGVTQVIPGDDMDLKDYWPPPARRGAPIHLLNVTVNETVDGKSQVQQQDRKGTGMCLGPCGLSVGVRHHLVAPFGRELDPKIQRIFPLDRNGDKAYRVFEYPGLDFRGELLPLGAWVGISGAAFTTGTGMRTSIGLSLLAGLANVRLGYWWDSNVAVDRRPGAAERRRGFLAYVARWFPVQASLLDELLARFPGTARGHWYLSDGGHFENMGGYELIRRRLPLIVIVDAEADPDYTYGGLANLVRKARLDFKAEIVFMKPEEIDGELSPEVACHVGSLEQLRRGRWKRREESCEEKDGKDRRPKRPVADFEGPERTGRCLVHAALARVKYDDGTQSRLLYVKPSLLGDEPEDVLDYHRQHYDFPQQTTADQFFDEAQWESYRRLGQHIAEKIFRTDEEGKEDRARAEAPRIVGTGDGEEPGMESEEARRERLKTLWNLGRLECPPEAVTNPG